MPLLFTTNTNSLHHAAIAARIISTMLPSEVCFYVDQKTKNYVIAIESAHGSKTLPDYIALMNQRLEFLKSKVRLVKLDHFAFLPTRTVRVFSLLADPVRLSLVFSRDEASAELTKFNFAKAFKGAFSSNYLVQVVLPKAATNNQFEVRIEGKCFFSEEDAQQLEMEINAILVKYKGFALLSMATALSGIHKRDFRVRGRVNPVFLDISHRFNPVYSDDSRKAEWKQVKSTSRNLAIGGEAPRIYSCATRKMKMIERAPSAPASLKMQFRTCHADNDPRRIKDVIGTARSLSDRLRVFLSQKYSVQLQLNVVDLATDSTGFSGFTLEGKGIYVESADVNAFARLIYNLLDEWQFSSSLLLHSVSSQQGTPGQPKATLGAPPEDHDDIKLKDKSCELSSRLESIASFDMRLVPPQYNCKLGLVLMSEPAYNNVTGDARHHCDLRMLAFNNIKFGKCPITRTPISEDSLQLDHGLRNEILTYVACAEYIAAKKLDMKLLEEIVANKHSLYWLKEKQGERIDHLTAIQIVKLANKHYANGEYREAIYCFEVALSKIEGLKPEQVAILRYNMGSSYLLIENYEVAAVHLIELSELDEELDISLAKHTKHLFKLALVHQKLGQLDQAEACFTRIIELAEVFKSRSEPKIYLDCYLVIAMRYSEMGLYEKAVEACDRVIERIPADFDTAYLDKVHALRSLYELQTPRVTTRMTALQALWRGYKVREAISDANIERKSDATNVIEMQFIVVADKELFPKPRRQAASFGIGGSFDDVMHAGFHDFGGGSFHSGGMSASSHGFGENPFHGGGMGRSAHNEMLDDFGFGSKPNPVLEDVIKNNVCKAIGQQCGLAIMNKLVLSFYRNAFSEIVAFSLRFEDLSFSDTSDFFIKFIGQVKTTVEGLLYDNRRLFQYSKSTVHKFTRDPVVVSQAAQQNIRLFKAPRRMDYDARSNTSKVIYDFDPS
jgi:tetratricopeptide (TPR) repeat protein